MEQFSKDSECLSLIRDRLGIAKDVHGIDASSLKKDRANF